MSKVPTILIESDSQEVGWVGGARCPRQFAYQDTKNMFCPNYMDCDLPKIFARAASQKAARLLISQTELPQCKNGRRFQFLDQAPRPADNIPIGSEVDFVVRV